MARQQRLRALMPAWPAVLYMRIPSCPLGPAPHLLSPILPRIAGTDPGTMHRTGTENLTGIRTRTSLVFVRILLVRRPIPDRQLREPRAFYGLAPASLAEAQGTASARNPALAARHPDPQMRPESRESRCHAGP